MPAFPRVYAAAGVARVVEEGGFIAFRNRSISASLFLKHNENRYMRITSFGLLLGSVSTR